MIPAFVAAALWGAALVGSAALAAPAGERAGPVVAVSDGDTVVVRLGGGPERVRLLGIDAPERSQAPWGERATAFLRRMVAGRTVRVETDVQVRDRYGRLLAYIHVDGTFVNRELVRQGYAMLYTAPPNVAHAEELLAAQREAREAGRNIWAADGGLTRTPYEYRHGRPPPRSIGQDGLRAGAAGTGTGAGASMGAAPSAGEAGAGEASPEDGVPAAIVANTRSRKFHAATCPLAAKISPRNRLELGTRAEAEAQGLRPCRACRGGR